MVYLSILCCTLSVAALWALWKGFLLVLWRPYAVTRKFQRQGITGPPYRLVKGCSDEIRRLKAAALQTVLDLRSHDYLARIFPFHLQWSTRYGETFLFWTGTEPWLFVSDVETVKQILSNKFGFFSKPMATPALRGLFGRGLIFAEGSDWVRHRRVLNPAFNTDKLKAMTKMMAACTLFMFDAWKDNAEMEMNGQFKQLTADIISHTSFGNSYADGKEVFEAQAELQSLAAATRLDVHSPVYRYLPNAFNNRRRSLEKKVNKGIENIVRNRILKGTGGYGNDLLGLMMDACATESTNKGGLMLSLEEIIDECKTFYFAGHETTASLLTWIVFLLSTNQEWQDRLRKEVLKQCGRNIPNTETVSNLKLVNMFLNETLRLYGPAYVVSRMATVDVKVGNLMIPKGTNIRIPMSILHRKKDIWGEDANEFNPLRFENGISKASKHPNGLLPFSMGPRICIGQNFAMLEAKIVMVMMLQRFSFSLSPQYKHAPRDFVTLQPQFGLPILVRTFNSV